MTISKTGQYRTGDQALVRQLNLSAILHYLSESAPISRAALAEATGLNKTTVSSLVRELLEYQFVREVGLVSAGTGRPAMLLEVNPMAGYMVSGEIGVDFLAALCSDFGPNVLCRRREPIEAGTGQDVVLQRMFAVLRDAVAEGGPGGRLLGVALGVPGLVDERTGELLFAPNLGWQHVPLLEPLRAIFDAPVFVGNEAKLAALGEYWFGVARSHREVLYINLGVGVGGAVVHDGQLYSGYTGLAGEFGHMTIDPEGVRCNCGNRGCWETLVSQPAVFRAIRCAVSEGQSTLMLDMVGGDLDNLTIPIVVKAAEASDNIALNVLNRVGHYLGVGIASLINALNPQLIVLGGAVSLAGAFLLPVIEDELQKRTMPWSRKATEIVLAQHGVDACLMGGTATVYQAVLMQPNQMI